MPDRPDKLTEHEWDVLDAISRLSQREAARELGISRRSVRKILGDILKKVPSARNRLYKWGKLRRVARIP